MKKIIAVCLVAVFATACKKNYTCVCTSTNTSNGQTKTTVDTYSATSSKKDAKAWCNAMTNAKVEATNATQTSTGTLSCELK